MAKASYDDNVSEQVANGQSSAIPSGTEVNTDRDPFRQDLGLPIEVWNLICMRTTYRPGAHLENADGVLRTLSHPSATYIDEDAFSEHAKEMLKLLRESLM